MKEKIFLLLALWLLGQMQAKAQPFNLTESIQPIELIFSDYKKDGEEKANGRISINPLSQEKDTLYYFIKGLSMYSPTYFSLNSSDASADIKVNLCKENWHTFHQTGQVNGKDIWKSKFKTEGDFGIMVIANKKPVRYVLLVWTGKEMNIAMPSVFKTADSAAISEGGWIKRNQWLLLLGVALLLTVLFLIFKFKKKKQ